MRDDTQIQADLIRAARARELLDNVLLEEALSVIEADVVKLWGESPQRDKEGKEALWQLYKTAQKFRGLLRGYVESGKYAQSELAHYEKTAKISRLFANLRG